MSRRKPPSVQVGKPLTDGQVVRRVLDGETALFEILFHRHSQRVYRAARGVLRDDDEAADVAQESFLRAYARLNQFAGRAKFSTWLTKIAVYEARARARRSRARERVKPRYSPAATKSREEPVSDPDQESRVLAQETRTMLEAAIDALPDLHRTVFVLREIEEMSTADTAECLNLGIDAVKTRLRRAKILLRKKLYTWGGPIGREAFRFAGRTCERMWKKEISPAIKLSARSRARLAAKASRFGRRSARRSLRSSAKG